MTEWFFSGIGSNLLTCIISVLIGGAAGYRLGVRQKVKQRQQAGDHATQIQVGNINDNGLSESRK